LRVLEGDSYGAVATVNGHGLLDRAGQFIAFGSLDFGDGVFTGLQARQLDDTVVVGAQVRAFIVVGTRHRELGALETRLRAGLNLLDGQAAENLRVLGVDDGRQVIGCQRDLFRFNGADVVALGSLGLDDLVGAAPLKAGELGDAVLVSSHRTPSVVTGLEYELGAGQADVAALVGLDDRDGAGLLLGLHLDGDVLLAAVDGYRDGFIQRLIACGSLYFLNVVGPGGQVRQIHLAGSVSGAVVENRSIGTGAHHLEAGAGHRLVIVVDLLDGEIAGCVFRVVPDIREFLCLVLDAEHTCGGQVVAHHGLFFRNLVLDVV